MQSGNPTQTSEPNISGGGQVHPSSVRMNPEIKAKWIAALRSGAYPQGRTYLEDCGHYCCLGVLCVVQGANIHEYFPGRQDRMTAFLPSDLNGGIPDEIAEHLAGMNDGDAPFSEIADWIDANL